MNSIRPTTHPLVQPGAGQRPAETAKSAAARAFFELAAGRPAAAPAPAAASAPAQAAQARATAPAQRAAQLPTEPPTRPMRPGSLLDIRV